MASWHSQLFPLTAPVCPRHSTGEAPLNQVCSAGRSSQGWTPQYWVCFPTDCYPRGSSESVSMAELVVRSVRRDAALAWGWLPMHVQARLCRTRHEDVLDEIALDSDGIVFATTLPRLQDLAAPESCCDGPQSRCRDQSSSSEV
jgi:hypothetical protein